MRRLFTAAVCALFLFGATAAYAQEQKEEAAQKDGEVAQKDGEKGEEVAQKDGEKGEGVEQKDGHEQKDDG